jgi:hypothetical protein
VTGDEAIDRHIDFALLQNQIDRFRRQARLFT